MFWNTFLLLVKNVDGICTENSVFRDAVSVEVVEVQPLKLSSRTPDCPWIIPIDLSEIVRALHYENYPLDILKYSNFHKQTFVRSPNMWLDLILGKQRYLQSWWRMEFKNVHFDPKFCKFLHGPFFIECISHGFWRLLVCARCNGWDEADMWVCVSGHCELSHLHIHV